jgi:hypothetical protein
MNSLLTDVSAWITTGLLALAMFVGWVSGWWCGSIRRSAAHRDPPLKFNDAILAVLGLLLAFTFSMSLGKHDHRRAMIVVDSNAIGDFYTCAGLLKEPARGKLQALVRQYVERRLSVAYAPVDEATFQQKLNEDQAMHRQMQLLVQEVVDAGTPLVVPLVNTLNELTSSHLARLAADRDRLPGSVVFLLFLAAVLSMAVIGRQQGTAQAWRPGSTIGFAILVCLVVWVILDLNQPERSWIKVSPEPLQQLLKGMQ